MCVAYCPENKCDCCCFFSSRFYSSLNFWRYINETQIWIKSNKVKWHLFSMQQNKRLLIRMQQNKWKAKHKMIIIYAQVQHTLRLFCCNLNGQAVSFLAWWRRIAIRSIATWPTRYLSVDTLTRIRSSPMRTFSPSDLCFEAGWMVHQQDSPGQTLIIKS